MYKYQRDPSMEIYYSLNMCRGNDGRYSIGSQSGRIPVPVTRLIPHPNTDSIQPGYPAVGHVEYSPSGTATFTQRDGRLVARESARDRVTGHTKEFELSTGSRLQTGDRKMITGTSWDGWNIRTGSSTHNTGAGFHCDRDRYTSNGSRQAGPVEQGMIRDMYDAWQRDGQPRHGWSYNPMTGRAEGPDSSRQTGRVEHWSSAWDA